MNSSTKNHDQHGENKPKDPSHEHLHSMLEFIWIKLQEKYITVAQAWRFFDIQNTGKLTKNDFMYGLETLKIKLTPADVTSVFDYLDKDLDGKVTYAEFCHLCEEKRRNIDPFD